MNDDKTSAEEKYTFSNLGNDLLSLLNEVLIVYFIAAFACSFHNIFYGIGAGIIAFGIDLGMLLHRLVLDNATDVFDTTALMEKISAFVPKMVLWKTIAAAVLKIWCGISL